MTKNKEYVVVAGFRRINACKKLGWNTIPALVRGTNKTMDLNMDSIDVIDEKNSRLQESDDELVELMDSIKQHGLLEPIVVVPADKLDEKEYTILNIIENVHRKNLSPTELSIVIRRLHDLGLSLPEIAVRLSMSKSRVDSVYSLSNEYSAELKTVDFIDTASKKGKIAFSTLRALSGTRMKVADKREILKTAKQDGLTVKDIGLLGRFTQAGNNLKQAKKMMRKYDYVTPTMIVNRKEFDKTRKRYGMSLTDIFSAMLTGKIPLNPKMVYFRKKIKSFESEDDDNEDEE